jgi:hypothetical protein
MKLKSAHIERILWILALSLALMIRLIRLGVAPLTDWEATNALPVFGWLQSGTIPAGSQAAYTLFSSPIFFLFGASNFAARFIPAILGSLLVLAPLLFRRQLGSGPAIIAAFGLALDPMLVGISRQADGSIWAVALTIFALGFLLNKRSIWAGICFGLALLGGPALWIGWLSLGIALWLSWKQLSSLESGASAPTGLSFRQVAIAAGITFLAGGTLFLFAPFGLSMAVGSLPEFIKSWTQTGDFTVQTGAIVLLSYAAFPLVLGLIQAISGWMHRDALDQFLSMWLVIALLLWFACPGRQMGFAGWIMVPLWALAARQAQVWLRKPGFDRRLTSIMAVVVFVLIFFIVLNAVAILHPAYWSQDTQVQIIRIVVAFVVLVLSIFLVGWGWNWDAASQGVQWGLGAALCLILVSMTLRAAGLSNKPQTELWRNGGYVADADLMQSTLEDLSTYKTGQRNQLQVSVVGIGSPSLEWLLRDFSDVQYSETMAIEEAPDVILTSAQIQPAQTSTYRGQDFVWLTQPAWSQMSTTDWLNWLVFRECVQVDNKVILWARTDLFP